jgi:pyruvate-formate lyase-activating enzyme
MVLFCIKHLDPGRYSEITGLRQVGALKFAAELREQGVPYWLRYVLIPGAVWGWNELLRVVCVVMQCAVWHAVPACSTARLLAAGFSPACQPHSCAGDLALHP